MPKTASTKPSKSTKQAVKPTPKPDKPKREPSAYNLFCKKHMKDWIAAHPGRAKEAMAHMALMWKDAPENPNCSKTPKAKRSKLTSSTPTSGLGSSNAPSSDPPSSDD